MISTLPENEIIHRTLASRPSGYDALMLQRGIDEII
jgi:hypothetical protein